MIYKCSYHIIIWIIIDYNHYMYYHNDINYNYYNYEYFITIFFLLQNFITIETNKLKYLYMYVSYIWDLMS